MTAGRTVRFLVEGLWIRASVYGYREMGAVPGGRVMDPSISVWLPGDGCDSRWKNPGNGTLRKSEGR